MKKIKKAIIILLFAVIISLLIFAGFRKNAQMNEETSDLKPGPDLEENNSEGYIPPVDRPPMPGIFDNYENGVFPPKPINPTEKWADGYFPQLHEPNPDSPYVTLHTNMGDIKCVLYPEAAPLTVKNFIIHCLDGYYDGTEFYRIVSDFIIQGGDPLGTGQGGESIYGVPFRDEVNEHLHHFKGALSMASWGTYLNASQFFIVQGDEFKKTYRPEKEESYKLNMMKNRISTELYTKAYDYMFYENPSEGQFRLRLRDLIAEGNKKLENGYIPDVNIDEAMKIYPAAGGAPHLDFQYTVFGQVVEGMDAVDAIAALGKQEDDMHKKVVVESTTVENAPEYKDNIK